MIHFVYGGLIGAAILQMAAADIGGRLEKPKPKPKPAPDSAMWNYTDGSVMDYSTSSITGQFGDQFGYSLSVASSGRLLIGAPNVDNGYGAVFTVSSAAKDGHIELTPDDEGTNSNRIMTSAHSVKQFGASVSLSRDGTLAAVSGRHLKNTPMVSIQAWSDDVKSFRELQVIDILHDCRVAGSTAGAPILLAAYGDVVVVGAPWLHSHRSPGSTFVLSPIITTNGTKYECGNALFLNDFSSDNTTGNGDGFGAALSAGNGYFAIGAPEYNHRNGAVAVYHYSQRQALPLITPPAHDIPIAIALNPDIFFGYSVVIIGDELYVGAPGFDDNKGAVFKYQLVFSQNEPSFEFRRVMISSDGHTNDMFGYSLAGTRSRFLAVGAPGHSMNGDSAGAVYLFDIATGSEHIKYVVHGEDNDITEADSVSTGGEFGISVAMSNDGLVVGADFYRGISNELSGAVFTGALPSQTAKGPSSLLTYFLVLGAALFLPVAAAAAITCRKVKESREAAASNESDDTGSASKDSTLVIDTSSHSNAAIDLSGHSIIGEATSRNAGSFSSYITAPSVFLNTAKTRFSALQQASPMHTPDAAPRNPMTAAPEVAI